jgi:amino-acid N-acetyltransferase
MTSVPGMSPYAIEAARPADLANIRWLLEFEGLPSADITEQSLESFLVYRDAIGIAGVVGLEPFGEVGLLRSLVVADGHLRRGVGKRLVAAAEALAGKLDIRAIFLLTTTAESYFQALGFRPIKRDSEPPAIKRCSQFQSLCPSSAVLMVKP